MFEERVVFGERAVLLSEVAGRLPRRVLLPGPGVTVAERAGRAIDPVAVPVVARVARAARELGIAPLDQDATDVAAADRLCPEAEATLAYVESVLDLGCWRYRLEHTEAGPELARVLASRPDALAPAAGAGEVIDGGVGTFGSAIPADDVWPDAVLSGIVARERLISHLRAAQYRDLAELSGCYPGIHQFLATEIALALHTTEAEAAAMLGAAEALRDRLPDTLDRLSAGEIDEGKAIAMVAATASTSAEVARAVEQRVLPAAETVTATTVRRRAGRAVIALDPNGAADRHRRARTERYVSRRVEPDGMARLSVFAPAQDIATAWEALTACADALKRPGDTRTLANRRADALAMVCGDILDAGGWTGLRLRDRDLARPRVTVTVPYPVLLGHRAPVELDGYGPICTEQALGLIGGGDLYRMVCDPLSGAVLDYGRTRYRPPPHLAEFVRARDGECPMPCCHHPAGRAQLDHVEAARPDPVTGLPAAGTTSADNLGVPCAHHHLAKDAGRGFTLRRDTATGTYVWTTPLGRAYTWTPEPHWHPDTDPIPAGDVAGAGTAPPAPGVGCSGCGPGCCGCGCGCGCGCARAPVQADGDWADHLPPENHGAARRSTTSQPNIDPGSSSDRDPDRPPF